MAQAPSFVATLGPQAKYDPITDKDKFEKELNEVIHKAIQASEVPIKEKHIRSAVIATWKEKSCHTLWKVVKTLPLQNSNTVCFKSCYLLHKMLRDGYPENAKKSSSHAKFVSELAKHWNHLGDAYSRMITSYLKVLWHKIAFHVKNPDIPANLSFADKPFEIPSDIDVVFHFSVEVFDYQSALLHFYAAVLGTMDSSVQKLSANQTQCRVTPFIPGIQDSAGLYDLILRLMRCLHTALPADTLTGHRERFNRQYHALRRYFREASKFPYVKKMIEIPELPEEPPDFLIGKYVDDFQLSGRVVLVQQQSQVEPDESLLRCNTFDGTILDLSEPAPPPQPTLQREDTDGRFNAVFGDKEFEPFVTEEPVRPQQDERDLLIEQLMKEIVELREKIEDLEQQNTANLELLNGLRMQLEMKENEITDYKELAEQACNESALLKQQLEASSSDSDAQKEAEERVQAAEQKFSQLREGYQKLRNEHITLLRTNGESQKKLSKVEKNLEEEETARMDLERERASLSLQLSECKEQMKADSNQLTRMKKLLQTKENESEQLQQSATTLKEELLKAEQTSVHSHVVSAVEQVEGAIKMAVREIEDPSFSGLTCTPEYLLARTKIASQALANATKKFSMYSEDQSAMGGALAGISSMGQSMSEVILDGAATAKLASAENEQKLMAFSKSVGKDCLNYLTLLKNENPNGGELKARADQLQRTINQLNVQATEVMKERELVEKEGESLGDVVEDEMTTTSAIIDDAARKIAEMLKRSSEQDKGINLEVNSRILDSCTDLMKSIQILIQRSIDLQREIVTQGSTADKKDFYKKNNNWSEGLISAAKQVGFGAGVLVDAADKVVKGQGKFEQLIVSSREIAASTAQLVAASKVKAHARSDKLAALKTSSKIVSERTGSVVASAQSGAQRVADEKSKIDFTKLTLNQAKRLEMESQVRALELEKELEMERKRLAQLRKAHYHLGGAAEGWEEEQTEQ